jgi:hypothetical protein
VYFGNLEDCNPGTQAFSAAALFQTTVDSNDVPILAKKLDGTDTSAGWAINLNQGRVQCCVADGTGEVDKRSPTWYEYTDGKPHLGGFTFYPPDTISIWVDGVKRIDAQTGSTLGSVTTTEQLKLFSSGGTFSGSIGLAMVWMRELTDAEWKLLAEDPFGFVRQGGTGHYWHNRFHTPQNHHRARYQKRLR